MGQKTVEVIRKKNGSAIFVKADVSQTKDVKKAIEITKE